MFKESLKVKGKVSLKLIREDGTIKQTMVKNLVVDVGIDHILERLGRDAEMRVLGSTFNTRKYQIQTRSDGTQLTADGGQGTPASFIDVVSNSIIDTNKLPILITGTGIPSETYITSLAGLDRVNISKNHTGISDAEVFEIGETDYTVIGAANNNFGTAFTTNFPTVTATNITLGHRYEIDSVGTTNWTTYGADSNLAGTIFTSTGDTLGGNGTAYEIGTGTGTVRAATMSHMGIGSGTTTPVDSDTALESQIVSVEIVSENLQPPNLIYNAYFASGTGTGTITEAGIFNADSNSSPDMLCRTTFPAINKGASDALEINWLIKVQRGA